MKDYATDKRTLFHSERRSRWTPVTLLFKGLSIGVLIGGAAAGLLYVYEQLPLRTQSPLASHAKPTPPPPPMPAKSTESQPFIRVQLPLPRRHTSPAAQHAGSAHPASARGA